MSRTPRTCRLDLDYKVYHETGKKVLKEKQNLVMSTVAERAVISEKCCVDDIEDFLETNQLDEVDDVEDLTEIINCVSEIAKQYRHCHAELKVLLDEKYLQDYPNSKQHVERMRDFTKKAKTKLKDLKKSKASESKEIYLEIERKKLLPEEEYASRRLSNVLESIDLEGVSQVSEIIQIISGVEVQLDDYCRLQCRLKVVLASENYAEFDEKVDSIAKLARTKISECKSKIKKITEMQIQIENKRITQDEELKIAESQKKKQDALDVQKEELLRANQAYKEIEMRCASLLSRFSANVSELEDQALLEFRKIFSDRHRI